MHGGHAGRNPGMTAGRLRAPRLFAEDVESAVAELLGIALAVFGKLDDCLGDHCRQRVSAINESKLGQRGLKCRGQVGNVFWTKRVVVFENRPDRHVQPWKNTPHARDNTFYIGGVCGGRRIGYGKSNWDRRRGVTDSTVPGIKQTPAEWPGRRPGTRSHSG